MLFHDLTLSAAGAILSRRQHDSAAMVPEAVAVFTRMIDRHGDEFLEPVDHPLGRHITLHWSDDLEGTAVASFAVGVTWLTTSLLLTRDDPEAQRTMQMMLSQFLRRTAPAIEPAHEVLAVRERPVIISLPWPVTEEFRDDVMLVADMETCLAAAYFTRPQD